MNSYNYITGDEDWNTKPSTVWFTGSWCSHRTFWIYTFHPADVDPSLHSCWVWYPNSTRYRNSCYSEFCIYNTSRHVPRGQHTRSGTSEPKYNNSLARALYYFNRIHFFFLKNYMTNLRIVED